MRTCPLQARGVFSQRRISAVAQQSNPVDSQPVPAHTSAAQRALAALRARAEASAGAASPELLRARHATECVVLSSALLVGRDFYLRFSLRRLAQQGFRLNERLREARRDCTTASRLAAQRGVALGKAHEELLSATHEAAALAELAASTVPGSALAEQALLLVTRLATAAAAVDAQAPRPVCVTWTGVAHSAVLRGTFDSWGDGVALAAEADDEASEMNSSAKSWRATLWLPPGDYAVKVLINGRTWAHLDNVPLHSDGDNGVLAVL